MRLATLTAILACLTVLAGCGDSSEETAPAAPAGGGKAATRQKVRSDWEADPRCKRPGGASRWGCSVGSYRCQAVVSGRGWSVSCAKPGRSFAFTIPRD